MSEDLFDMSDEDLEAAFKAAKAGEESPDTAYEEDLEAPQEDEEVLEEDEDDTDFDDSDDDDIPEDKDDELDVPDAEEGTEQETEEPAVVPAANEAPKPRVVRAAGQEYSFTDKEMLDKFPAVFGQAMDYTRKMQAIKPWRETIDAIEQAGIKQEDLNLAIDVLKGNKEAIGEVLRRHEIDTYDIEVKEEATYTPQQYGRDAQTLAIRDVLQDIQHDPEFTTTRQVLENGWDEASWNYLSEDPERIRQLHVDVKSGLFHQLQGEAQKYKLYDGGKQTDIAYYMQAANAFFQQRDTQALQNLKGYSQQREQAQETARIAAAKEAGQQRAASNKAASARRAAAPTANRTRGKTVVNYLDSTDEDFDSWYAQLLDKM